MDRMNGYVSREIIEELRKEYKPGTVVSDVVVIRNGKRKSAYYVDNMGFAELAGFIE